MRPARPAILAGIVPLLFALTYLGAEVRGLNADAHLLASRPSYGWAWSSMGAADFHDFMVFAARYIPDSASVVSIALQPAFGYYRGSYELYPRTVWPIVSPLGLHAHDAPVVTASLLRAVLARTRAGYIAVWRVAMPRPPVAHRWIETFARDEYVVALR